MQSTNYIVQSKTAALIEKVTETAFGFAMNFSILNWILNPILDMNLHASGSLASTIVFTIISFGRGYLFRRLFTKYHQIIEKLAAQLRHFFKQKY